MWISLTREIIKLILINALNVTDYYSYTNLFLECLETSVTLRMAFNYETLILLGKRLCYHLNMLGSLF